MTDPFSIDERMCPDCQEIIPTNIILNGKIETCADHASFEVLQEAYRWLKEEHKRTENRFHELARGTALEKALADLKEANQSRAKLGAERYLLKKKVEDLESRCRYWRATAKEYEETIKRLIAASGELIKAEGGAKHD